MKRSGIELLNARTRNANIARETIAIIKQGSYASPTGAQIDISETTTNAIKNTILYDKPLPKKEYTATKPTIEVLNETTAQAATRLLSSGKDNIVALNFAAARNQGGGFLNGASAQEEDLCRCSSLYSCLKSKPMFYNKNILCNDPYYTNDIIYSPKVPFFRNEHNLFLEEPFLLSIISSPAPNLSGARPEGLQTLLKGILRERAMKIFEIAEAHGHKTLILGAWGCGAFGNSPAMVAEAFKLAMQKVPTFEHICFAVYDTREPPVLFETFKAAFANHSLT
jgi:uncharacterized protein (TIGR02452 family)